MIKAILLQLEQSAHLSPQGVRTANPQLFAALAAKAAEPLKAVLKAAFGDSSLAVQSFIESIDLATLYAPGEDITAAVQKKVAAARLTPVQIKELADRLQKLQESGELVDPFTPDTPLGEQPFIQAELQQAKTYRLAEIVGLPDANVEAMFANGHTIATLNDDTLQTLVTKASLNDSQARELGLAVNLYSLFDENMELTTTVKQSNFAKVSAGKISQLRDLAVFAAGDWLEILHTANVTPPTDMTLEGYADVLSHTLATLYPTDAFFTRFALVTAPELALGIEGVLPLLEKGGSVFSTPGFAPLTNAESTNSEVETLRTKFRQLLESVGSPPGLGGLGTHLDDPQSVPDPQAGLIIAQPGVVSLLPPGFGPSVFDRLRTEHLDEPKIEMLHTTYLQLKRLVNRYPGLGLGTILDDPQLTSADKVGRIMQRIGWLDRVRTQNPTVELLHLDYRPGSTDVATLTVEGLSESEQAVVLTTLKACQLAYTLTKDVNHARLLLEAGYSSATTITNVSFDTFASTTGFAPEIARHYYEAARTRMVTVGAGLGAILDQVRGGFNWLNVSNMRPIRQQSGEGPALERKADFARLDNFEALFGNQTYCQCTHCQSIFSPAAYFVDLMCFLDKNVPAHKLYTRRPDLWTVELTCENTNTEIPTLDLINEILENFVFQDRKLGAPTDQAGIESAVFEFINTCDRYFVSFQRPFVLPLEKLQNYLAIFGYTRTAIAQTLGAAPAVVARTTLNLSLDEYKLITETKTDLTFLNLFLISLEPLPTPGSPGPIPAFDVQQLLKPIGLSRSELGDLIKTGFINGGVRIVAEKRKDSVQNDIEVIINLTPDVLDRMHRFVRLWRRLPATPANPDRPRWSMAELDLILRLLGNTNLAAETVNQVAAVLQGQERLGTSFAESCALLTSDLQRVRLAGQDRSDLLFDRLFNRPAFGQAAQRFPRDTIAFIHPAFLKPAEAVSADTADAIQRLQVGLQLSAEELYLLIIHLDQSLGLDLSATPPKVDFYLTAQNLTLLYHHALLAKRLKLSIPELFQVIELALSARAVKHLIDITTLLDFYEWWQSSGYTLDDLSFITGGKVRKPEVYPAPQDIVQQLIGEAPLTEPFDVAELLRVSLAAQLSLSVERLTIFFDIMGLVQSQYRGIFTRARQSDAAALMQLTELIGNLLPLTVLFRNAAFFDEKTLAFISLYAKDIFGSNHWETLAQIRKVSVYTTLAQASEQVQLPSKEAATNASKISAVLFYLAKPQRNETEQNVLVQGLAKLLNIEVGLAVTLLNGIPLPPSAPEALLRLRHCAEFAQRLGVDGTTLSLIISDETSQLAVASNALQAAFRAQSADEKAWQTKISPIEEELRSRKRDILTDFLLQLSRMGLLGPNKLETMNDLYHHFLIDVELAGCARTSRVVAAISSVQLYVQRILMNLEPVKSTTEMAKEWEWRKNYRLWEANRKVFLYPENYIEPDLRDDKTPLFETLESTLLQQEIKQQNVLDAYAAYLSGFEAVARLKIAGSYHDKRYDAQNNVVEDTLHLFGVTPDNPPTYYYRAVNNAHRGAVDGSTCGIDWSHWRKVEVQIPVRKVAPIVYLGRLYVFWVEITTTPQNDLSKGASVFAGYKHKLTLKYTNLRLDGTWTAPQTISLHEPSVFPLGDGIVADPLKDMNEFATYLSAVDTYSENKTTANYHAMVDAHRQMYTPQYDTVAHLVSDPTGPALPKRENDESVYDYIGRIVSMGLKPEPKDGYTLTGFQWDQIYPTIYRPEDNDKLVITGVNFTLQGSVDFYRKSVTQDTITQGFQEPPKPFSQVLSSYLRFYADEKQWQYLCYCSGLRDWRYPNEYASCADFLQNIEKFGSEGFQKKFKGETLTDIVVFRDIVKQPVDISVINGSLQDCIVDAQGDLFLVQGSTRIPPNCLLTRLGTTLSAEIVRKLFMGGVDALLDIKMQEEELLEASLPLILQGSPPYIEINRWTQQSIGGAKQRFDFKHGPYGVYYREIFFQIPFLIANHLNSQGRFADAQRWYHYLFNPTASESTMPPENRNWRYLEFRESLPTLRSILTDSEVIEVYKRNPWSPHAIARLRFSAYQKCIVMKYLDNLLDWGDSLFAQFTRESVNEATMLYIMAADILGERPPELGECSEDKLKPKNYTTIEPYLNQGDFLQEVPVALETYTVSQIYPNARKVIPTYRYALNGEVLNAGIHSASLASGANNAGASEQGGIFKAYAWKKTSTGAGGKSFGGQASPLLHDPELIADFSTSLMRSISYAPEFKDDPTSGLAPIFCIPVNKELLGYWDRVADRLYKIRHCLDMNGVRRDLALFAPEIDPHLLVRMKAAGLTLEDVLGTTSANIPAYRFAYLIEKAKQYASAVQGFGSALLSALEKKDVEQLNNLRTVHEQNILKLTRQSKQWEIEAESESLKALEQKKETVAYRKEYYQGLVDEELMPWERTQQVSRHTATGSYLLADMMSGTAGILSLIPQLGSPFAMKYGGHELGKSAEGWASMFRDTGRVAETVAASAGLEATFERREQEWEHQIELANRELKEIERQLIAAKIRQQITNRALEVHDKNIEQTKEVYDFYAGKFSNFGLYTWLSTTLQTLYRDAYNSAVAMAQLAERAFRFERSDDKIQFLATGYWEASKAGLLADERLLLDLQNMERRFIETNYRTLEINQSFSLMQIDPRALIGLRESGSCAFTIPEVAFDLFYPGQYRRKIKAVRLTIPCVTGPYTNVSATLRLTGSELRNEPKVDVSLLKVPPQRSVCIATSSAQNDAGVFELNFHDERYMPFEGAGAVESSWQLDLPKNFRQFDYQTISDVMLHISYTAEEDGNFRGEVENVNGVIESELAKQSLYRVFSLRQEFPSEFHRLMHSPVGTEVKIKIEHKHFLLFLQGFLREKKITEQEAKLVLQSAAGQKVGRVKINLNGTDQEGFAPDSKLGDLPAKLLDNLFINKTVGVQEFTFKVSNAGDLAPESPVPGDLGAIDDNKLLDVLLYVEYLLVKKTP